MAEQDDTQAQGGAAQSGAEGSATTPAAAAGSGGSGDRVSLLESRLAGLEAKLTESGRSRTQAEKERDAALQRLADYEAGKLKDNEAFQAELQRERDRAAAAERAASVARIEAKYPESFGVLGEAAASLSEEALAANEARLKGVAPSGDEPPTPRTPAAQRPSAGNGGAEADGGETLAQMRARLRQMTAPGL